MQGQYINPKLFKELYYMSVDLFYKNLPVRKLRHGYHLFAIDGSKFELPNSKSNFEFFGEMFSYSDPNRKFTMGVASVDFREIYFCRWPVGIKYKDKYKELKSRLRVEEFNGATTISVLQEFYTNMLLSNIASLVKNQVDEELEISDMSSNKHRYQANRSFIIGRIKKLLPKILCGIYGLSCIDALCNDAYRHKSQITPGRKYKRKKNNAIGQTHLSRY